MKPRLELFERGVRHGFTRAIVGDDEGEFGFVLLILETYSQGGKSNSIVGLPPEAARHLAECLNYRADAVEQAASAEASA